MVCTNRKCIVMLLYLVLLLVLLIFNVHDVMITAVLLFLTEFVTWIRSRKYLRDKTKENLPSLGLTIILILPSSLLNQSINQLIN